MNKKKIAVVAGGFSGEYPVSILSAENIYKSLDRSIYEPYKVIITKDKFFVELDDKKIDIDKSDFSFIKDKDKILFDYAYITIHGTPGEDGVLQGYFDLLGIPYNTAGVLQEALTFNKYFCNKTLSAFQDINVAKSIRLTKENRHLFSTGDIISELSLPLFVKPNVGGSSVATSKVKVADELDKAISVAFDEASEVIVEAFMKGVELTCGVYSLDGEIYTLPISEVISKNEFFDYEAKYQGAVEEITPARISDSLRDRVWAISRKIYSILSMKGIIRIDYIVDNDNIQLLEVNTTPGMTSTSFIPQQVEADNKNLRDFLTAIIENKSYL